ncbi:hypothetical protein C0J08_17520 [Marinomonas sp. CT5]|uniref:hypothetical protein n=1 Tax=Marinomonas sp. CT5 TaxID=2066133 RepID=UPI001BAE636B|nr:hypothetical protein [Marinomonas sp. CT5]QUX97089.1 hypothetical protein C0J08_17520 [Marinomonas sp. CT5]
MEVKVNSTTIRSFSIYSNTLPNNFLLDVAKAWRLLNATFKTESTERTYYQHITRWLRFLADRPSHPVWSYIGQDNGSLAEEYLAWQNLLTEYRNYIFDTFFQEDQLNTRNNQLMGVRKLLEYLAYTKTIPHGLVLRGWKEKQRLGQSSTFLSNDFYRLINRSKYELQKIVDSFDDNDVSLDEDTLSLIKHALENTEEDFDFNPISLVISSLQNRKIQLKDQAASDYIAYIDSTNQAKKWAENLEISACADKFHKAMLSNVDAHTKMHLYNEALGGSATSVLVNYLIRYNEGRLLLNTDSRYSLFWHPDRMSRYNYNRDHIRRYLGCSNYGMVCAFAFIMLETNANTTSVWGLKEDDLIDLDKKSFQLNWTKKRQRGHEAKYKKLPTRIVELAPQTLTVRDVFLHQIECRKKFLKNVIQKDQKYLFLQWHKNNVKISVNKRVYAPSRPSLTLFNRFFKQLCKKGSNGAWITTPKAIRGSALLLTGLVTRDATAVMIEGQHGSLTMGKRYTYHYPEIWQQDKEIRLFLNWYQALFTVDIEGFAEKIGIDPILYDENKEFALEQRQKEAQNAINQQFGGIHCIDPTVGAQPGTKAGSVCNKVDKCPTCKQRRGVFVTSINNLANVIQWHEVLVQLNQTLSDNDFYKWRVWHVFTTLILDTFSKDPTHARLMREAQEKATLTQNSYASLIPVAEVNI